MTKHRGESPYVNMSQDKSNPLQVIDISLPQEEILSDLLKASVEQGFLFIDGHGIPAGTVDTMFDISKEFFTTVSEEEKLKYLISTETNIGYTHYNSEQLDPRKTRDFKECYNFGHINFETGEFNQSTERFYSKSKPHFELETQGNSVPQVFQNHSAELSKIMVKLFDIAREIMRLIARSLKIENENFFVDRMRKDVPNKTVFRMLRYPLVRTDEISEEFVDEFEKENLDDLVSIRAGAHTDYGALTLLFQKENQEGLQLEINDKWLNVPYIKSRHSGMAPPLVVNFGDLLSFWTNGLLKSTTHRVKFSPQETRNSDRYSIVFFVHPENDTTLDPIPSNMIPPSDPAKERNPLMTAVQHLEKRLKDTYN